ncbi:hypothetical protein SASPL_149983 [Salvia splendens]|uniref:Uncharacterized protein n=1 Tax=Salvia splendens TaxID=180675 RepID=A0A8X8W5M8_SALSN|nr:hypothetical protein SASPL_149983 [Salvia splendens]
MRKMRWRVGLMLLAVCQVVNSDECSGEIAADVSIFQHNANATWLQLRANLSEAAEVGKMFATAQAMTSADDEDPVYAMAQCRNYMSQADCLTCYDKAFSLIKSNCVADNQTGGRVSSEGCFLRYEDYDFYERISDSWPKCENVSSSDQAGVFRDERRRLLDDLQVATPRMKGTYFAASKRNTVYALAQCVLSVTEDSCRSCLQEAKVNLQTCSDARNGSVSEDSCFMRYSDQPFFPDDYKTDLDLLRPGNYSLRPLSVHVLKNVMESELKKLVERIDEKAVIGGTVGGSLLFVIVAITFVWFKFSRHLKNALIANILGATQLQLPNRYSYTDLKEATNNFSNQNKIGQGAFGAVYKATLKNETVVAVKKLDMKYSRAKADFESEVRLISNVHHRNLVRLLGCCTKGSDLLLVYEFMDNKSLDIFLYAKIADFGLARLLPENQTHASTNFAGTLEYTAPEYAIGGHLSEKVDIYGFGIVMLEIISGRKSTDVTPDSTLDYLLKEAWKLYERDMHQNLVDVALNSNEYQVEEVKKMVEIAMLCVQSTPSSRPTMSQVIFMLSGDGSVGLRRAVRTPSFSYEIGVQIDSGNLLSTQESASQSDATTSLTE